MATILVADDDASVRLTLAEALEREGHVVLPAPDAASALRIARDRQPDLVILEPVLPGSVAFEICRALRTETTSPIIIVTSRSDELDKVVGLELGADDYVVKPFSTKELLARIRVQLRRARREPLDNHAPAVYGDLHINFATREVRKAGEPVRLRPREFDLLAFLVHNAGRTFSREQLLNQIWGYASIGRTRTVDVHVNRIRTKIEDDPASPRRLISSRGQGYRFEA